MSEVETTLIANSTSCPSCNSFGASTETPSCEWVIRTVYSISLANLADEPSGRYSNTTLPFKTSSISPKSTPLNSSLPSAPAAMSPKTRRTRNSPRFPPASYSTCCALGGNSNKISALFSATESAFLDTTSKNKEKNDSPRKNNNSCYHSE